MSVCYVLYTLNKIFRGSHIQHIIPMVCIWPQDYVCRWTAYVLERGPRLLIHVNDSTDMNKIGLSETVPGICSMWLILSAPGFISAIGRSRCSCELESKLDRQHPAYTRILSNLPLTKPARKYQSCSTRSVSEN